MHLGLSVCLFVCVSVCLSEHVTQKQSLRFTCFVYTRSIMPVARSSSNTPFTLPTGVEPVSMNNNNSC